MQIVSKLVRDKLQKSERELREALREAHNTEKKSTSNSSKIPSRGENCSPEQLPPK